LGGCRSLARDGAHHVAEQWHILPGILHKWVEVYPVNSAAVHGEYLRDITKREQTANYLVHCSSAAKERGSYHHRDLRRALTRSALEILSEAGVVGLSLRAATRRAKVSAMAPYRHFADKEALLAAVAEYGFQLLEARLTTATATAADPRAGLAALGVAYVLFARDEPSLFKLMFGLAIEKKSAHPALDQPVTPVSMPSGRPSRQRDFSIMSLI
jgi:hypothetical protein